ncbi:TetR/AcrR family transcriptional regulator [Blastococcus sp. LR1]|uniref:TetR/AcrR family transcriptional regulator n=1 Tax=Blastococcus sp. LR1 TaxID=2877000 RepID=UPI001CCEE3B5|nr:TetR family transcriptional regulator [Blastococcus sp. LR1]MCA0144913.1 TetR/AcrR family transcriptional regulator [Blastococcus sp. LR1]
MSELLDRRAQKKALTRAHVRAVAQELFAERGFDAVTIADVARAADVAVQTVFNHFSTKEELFFDGRTPWVTGPADAVRDRTPGMTAHTALRNYLVALVRGRFGALASVKSRTYLRTIEGSDALLAHERDLIHECERRLTEALHEVWASPDDRDGIVSQDPATAATLTAATWLGAARALIIGQRSRVTAGACPLEIAETLGQLAERFFDAAIATMPAFEEEAGAAVMPAVEWPASRAS